LSTPPLKQSPTGHNKSNVNLIFFVGPIEVMGNNPCSNMTGSFECCAPTKLNSNITALNKDMIPGRKGKIALEGTKAGMHANDLHRLSDSSSTSTRDYTPQNDSRKEPRRIQQVAEISTVQNSRNTSIYETKRAISSGSPVQQVPPASNGVKPSSPPAQKDHLSSTMQGSQMISTNESAKSSGSRISPSASQGSLEGLGTFSPRSASQGSLQGTFSPRTVQMPYDITHNPFAGIHVASPPHSCMILLNPSSPLASQPAPVYCLQAHQQPIRTTWPSPY
jgi:hypothetical protein